MNGGGALKPRDLLKIARVLAENGSSRPSQVMLRRAVSSNYYALFHALARNCADLLIGSRGSTRSDPAWRQVYRAAEHGIVRKRCGNQDKIRLFPSEIRDFAAEFVSMQKKRHKADYDPSEHFIKSAVLSDIDICEDTIAKFESASKKDRRAFCAYVLLNERNL